MHGWKWRLADGKCPDQRRSRPTLCTRDVTVVVTGAAGFIGARLANAMLDGGQQVVGVDRLGADGRLVRAWDQLCARDGFVPHVVDLADERVDLNPLMRDADAVIHLAGRPGTHASWTEYSGYLRDNVAATARVAQACLETGVPRLVHASSSSVYGRIATGDETSTLRPISPYGASKLAAESTLHAFADAKGLPVVTLRLFSVYGPGQRPDMGVYSAIAAALDGAVFEIHGDGRQTRSMTYVDDAVAAIGLAVSRGRIGGTYNIGGASSVSLLEILHELWHLVGSAARVVAVPDPPGNQRHTSADVSAAALELGYAPKVGISEGLTRQVAWQRG